MAEPHTQVPNPGIGTSLDLLRRAQAGDSEALNALISRYLPRLARWASGRLPPEARGLADTQDVVQETVSQAFRNIERFEIRGEGALQAYLRQALLNRIRQEIRRARRRLPVGEADNEQLAVLETSGPSPLEQAIGREAIERYEAALQRLRPEDREMIIGRVELGLSHQEVADAMGKPSANAARMAIERALARLVQEMNKTAGR